MTADLGDKQGIDEAARQNPQAFFAAASDDQQAVGELRQWFAKIAPQLIDEFYSQLLSDSPVAGMLQDSELVERLKQEHLRRFEEIATGVCDEPDSDNLAKRERSHVERVLKRERYNRSRAARALGINRRSLFRLIEKYEIDFPDKGL